MIFPLNYMKDEDKAILSYDFLILQNLFNKQGKGQPFTKKYELIAGF